VAQKVRKETKAKAREKAERRRVTEEKKKKKTLEYLQQLWNEMLEKEATLLEGAEGSQIAGPKCKEILLENNVDCWPSKKAKGKQPARYQGNIRIKLGDANPCERYVCTRQDCLVYHSR